MFSFSVTLPSSPPLNPFHTKREAAVVLRSRSRHGGNPQTYTISSNCIICSSRKKYGTRGIAMTMAMVILLSSHPAEAGVLSGSTGLESVPHPELPEFDFLRRIQDFDDMFYMSTEESQKKSDANDAKFKSSPLLQELLKRSKANAERNKQEIQDKYCERGAEWGVGDCSTAGMSIEEKEAFMEMLREKRSGK